MNRAKLAGLLLLFLSTEAAATQFFVSATGSDSNAGTFDAPFLTIAKAVGQSSSVFTPGDTVYVRGGVYPSAVTISLSKTGLSTARYYLLAYPNERPLLDFSAMAENTSNRGIRLSGNYWHIRGFDVKGAGDNGMHVSGSYNIIEFCSFSENRDTGLQLSNGASYNQIINCDSFNNADSTHGNADGFAPKLDVGTGNYLYGCRAWQNSDDGYDGYLRPSNDVETVLENCWIFKNGYLKDGSASSGNGNGIKMGGSDARDLRHHVVLKNCVAFDNRVKGFDQNNNRGSMTLYNTTAYRNGTNYAIAGTIDSGQTLTLINCVALGSYGSIGSFAVQQTNSWLSPFSVTQEDFLSIDTTGVRGPRSADGSLPPVDFLHLAPGSDLIDGGTDVGHPYKGLGPDLGAFETDPPTAIPTADLLPANFRTIGNFPNPFNPSTALVYEIPGPGTVSITIVDVLGRKVKGFIVEHGTPGRHLEHWDGTDENDRVVVSGHYFGVVEYRGERSVLRLSLLR